VSFTDIETALYGVRPCTPTKTGPLCKTATPEVLDSLHYKYGISLFTHANNHAYDLGTECILNAIDEMNERKMIHAGTGNNISEASRPGIFYTKSGLKIALVAAASHVNKSGAATAVKAGVNALEGEFDQNGTFVWNSSQLTTVIDGIQVARASADIVIVYFHNHYWEDNWVNESGIWEQYLARLLIDFGADIYVSHGPPAVHGIEIYKGSPIFYSLGNFIFQVTSTDGYYPDTVWDSVMVRLTYIDTTLLSVTFTPIMLNSSTTNMDIRGFPVFPIPPEHSLSILQRLQQLSKVYNTTISIDASLQTGSLEIPPHRKIRGREVVHRK